MKIAKTVRSLIGGMLVGTLLLAATPAPQAAPVTVADVSLVQGQGWLQKLACIGCMSGLLAAGATNVVGAVALAIAYPEIVASCGLGCAVAFAH